MGNIAMKVSKRALRPFKNFAVESRTDRILAKDKPTPAPWHPSTQKRIDELIKEHSHLFEDQNKKDEILDNRLKEIYVTTQDESHTQKDTPSKPLPTERRSVEPPEFGYMEPAKVTKGKLSMRQALILIGKHSEDPTVYTAELLAHEHTIHPRVAENILKYFRTFEYYQPPSKTKAKISVKDYINLKSLPLMSKPNKDDQVETQRIKSD